MSHDLAAEANRLGRQLSRIATTSLASEAAGEVPMAIHSKEFEGEALSFSPAFVRYVGSICSCGRQAMCVAGCWFIKSPALGHLPECEPACRIGAKFHRSDHRNHPLRLKRALRQVRKLNPKAYDFVYLIVARGYSFEDAASKINSDNAGRGQPERSLAEYGVLWVSGASMLAAAF